MTNKDWMPSHLQSEKDALVQRERGQVAPGRGTHAPLDPHGVGEHVTRYPEHVPDRRRPPVDVVEHRAAVV